MTEQSKAKTGKFIIGITGNIATGKSAVMRMVREEGALTIDADKLVHEIMDPLNLLEGKHLGVGLLIKHERCSDIADLYLAEV